MGVYWLDGNGTRLHFEASSGHCMDHYFLTGALFDTQPKTSTLASLFYYPTNFFGADPRTITLPVDDHIPYLKSMYILGNQGMLIVWLHFECVWVHPPPWPWQLLASCTANGFQTGLNSGLNEIPWPYLLKGKGQAVSPLVNGNQNGRGATWCCSATP